MLLLGSMGLRFSWAIRCSIQREYVDREVVPLRSDCLLAANVPAARTLRLATPAMRLRMTEGRRKRAEVSGRSRKTHQILAVDETPCSWVSIEVHS